MECKDFEFSLGEMGNLWRVLNLNILKGLLFFVAGHVLEHPLIFGIICVLSLPISWIDIIGLVYVSFIADEYIFIFSLSSFSSVNYSFAPFGLFIFLDLLLFLIEIIVTVF